MEGSFLQSSKNLDYIKATGQQEGGTSPRNGSFVDSRGGSFISEGNNNKTILDEDYRSNESIEDQNIDVGVYADNAITYQEYKRSVLEQAKEEEKLSSTQV